MNLGILKGETGLAGIASSDLFSQLMRYGLVGVANTFVGLGVILILQMLAGLDPYSANAGGYAVGLATSFLLNRAWTFRVSDRPADRLLRFMLAFAISYTANLGTLALLINPVGMVAAQAVAVVVYSTIFFVFCRVYVFAPQGQPV
jgi:putative flippase GtrA